MTPPQLEIIVGDLRVSAQLEPGTFRHVDELMNERRTAAGAEQQELRNNWFYAADGHGYFATATDVEWAITRESDNLVLRHLLDERDSSFDQLVNKVNYRPANEEALAAKMAADTVVVAMSKLRLSGTEKEWRYLEIRTEDGFINTAEGYQAPNDEEQKVLQRLGYTAENLAMLSTSNHKIAATRLYVLNPAYIQEEAVKDPEKSSLWRASRLGGFGSGSSFGAKGRSVGNRCRLRGVRRGVEARSAAAPERVVPDAPVVPLEITPAMSYQALLADPAKAAAALDDKTVAGLSRIVADYLATKAQ